MAQCDIQALLDNARCFYGLNPQMALAVELSLWCQISEGVSSVLTNPVILSDDGNWYQISAVDLGEGDATISIGDTAQPPGTHPYLVLLNVDDGLHYKLSLTGTPPEITYTIDETPTAEPVDDVILTDGASQFHLQIAAGLTIELTPV